jgi:hypothetical protein
VSDWQDMVAAALVGTARAQPPALHSPIGALLAHHRAADREGSLLAAAGALDLWQRAGWKPATLNAPLAEPASPESLPLVHQAAVAHLQAALEAGDEPLVKEWLALAARTGQRAPPELLPALLDLAARRRILAPLLAQVGGQRGAWLVPLNPAWRAVPLAPEGSGWETATRRERLALLGALRGADPPRARDLLAAAWKEEPAEVRAALVMQLATGLSMEDEPFLEEALEDRSKEVRLAIAELLARLPESRLVGRMAERAAGWLRLEQRGFLRPVQLAVKAPAGITPELQRDGVDPKLAAAGARLGERALVLLQVLACVPPAHWSARFQLPPGKLLDAAARTEWADAVQIGWAWAAARVRDAGWATALLQAELWKRQHLPFPAGQLARAVPEPERAHYLAERLQAISGRQAAAELADLSFLLLGAFDGPWPDLLARAFLACLRRVAAGALEHSLGPSLAPLLDRIPPALASEAVSAWPAESPWNAVLTPLLDRLRLRAEMHRVILQE